MLLVENESGIAVIRLSGDLDATRAPQAKACFSELHEKGADRLVIDMSRLKMIDSSGLGALVVGLKQARASGGDLRLCGVANEVKTVLRLTRLERMFTVYPDREAAVMSYGS